VSVRPKHRSWYAATVAGAFVFALGGCPGHDAQLAVRTNPYIADIPVPRGFDRNEKESSYSHDGTARRVLELYEGHAQPLRVRNFYESNMPAGRWEKATESMLEGGIYTFQYKKGKEVCNITIRKKPSGGWGPPTEVRITVETH
jgi:hypothetical protein